MHMKRKNKKRQDKQVKKNKGATKTAQKETKYAIRIVKDAQQY